ncbi:MAG: TIGR03842 family LLM class F420-dependent oxidoreductase [Thermoleophilia bacterium]
MDFGLTLQTDPPARRLVELFTKAEGLGFTHAWTFDSHILWQEPYVIHSQVLSATERMMVGPLVTNPASRDPTVTASVFATLNDMFGNRTICAIGRGDSALRVLGRKPTTLAQTERAIHEIRELAEGRAITGEGGAEVRIPWVKDGRLEVWMAAYGPKALSVVGRCADGFVLQVADPEILRWTLAHVRAAAEGVGRDPDEITVLVCAPAYVGDDIAHAREQCRWFGGMVGNHVVEIVERYGTNSEVPQALTDYVAARKGYDYTHHGRAGNPSTDFVPDEIVDRFCILGDPAAHVAKLEELRDAGMDQFAIYLMHDAPDRTLDAYGAEVIPAFAEA